MAKEHQATSAPNDAPVSAGQPSDPADRLAHAVSAVMNPGYVALPTFLVVAVAPLLYVALGVRAGRFSDHHLSVREQRLVPFVVGLVSAGAAWRFCWRGTSRERCSPRWPRWSSASSSP